MTTPVEPDLEPPVEPMDDHNRVLVANAHPPDWENPEPRNPYNLVVIGAGTAGLVSAVGSAGLGARVALVERHLMGGDCLNTGCVPSKAFVRAARAAADARAASRYGVHVDGDVRVDFARVMEWVRETRATISVNDSVKRMTDLGMDVFLGDARFVSDRLVEVDGKRLELHRAVVATGARSSVPSIDGLEEAGFLTSETVFNLTEQPPRLAVIGGGPIGCELGQSFARLGTAVTLLESGKRVLGKDDPDAARVVQGALVADGVRLCSGVRVERVETYDGAKVVHFSDARGEAREVEVDAILVAVGRRPNVADLGLEAAGIDFDEATGVIVDDRLRTTNARVYAAGDVASAYRFTHAADFLARTVIRNALFAGSAKASALTIPWATYTDPEVAHVGLTPASAVRDGVEVETFTKGLNDVDRAVVDGETAGFVRVHVQRGTDTIIGATVVARHAGDMIGELTMAIEEGIGLATIANVIHPYPTQAEAIRHTGDAYSRTRLTPTVGRWLKRWLEFRRGRDR